MATKRDQVIRSWISRPTKGARWHSYVSHQGKLHDLSTHTHLRKAALDFARLHTIAVLTKTRPPDQSDLSHQPSLFTDH